MIKLLKYTITSIIISLLLLNNSNSIENRILFKVDNEIITSVDIMTELEYLRIINNEFKNTDKENAYEISKNSLIREKIKEIEIKKLIKKIEIEDKILNNLILSYFDEFGIKSILEFEKYFLNKDINPNLIRKKISLEMLWNQLIYSKYNQNIKINKELIKKNLLKREKQKQFLISEILFDVNENENLNDKYNLIEKSIKKINFSQAALTYSISNTSNKGGNLGWVSETILNKKIYDEIKSLKNGKYTKPILVPGGFLILQLNSFREVTIDFNIDEEVKKIVKEKSNKQLNRFSNIYFNKIKKDIVINEF
jgi:peptidyl-prolyl cis-trans isomerase SurA